MITKDWKIQFITDWGEIFSKSFQDQWLQLVEKGVNNHVFFHPALGSAWLETYRSQRNLKPLFCIAKNNNIEIFLPLVLWKQNWKNAFRKVIIPVGYSDFDYHEPLTDTKLSEDEVLSFWQSLKDSLILTEKFDAIEINGIRTEISGKNWSGENDFAPFCDLSKFQNSELFLMSLSTSLRGDIRRQIRRINEYGQLKLYHYKTVEEALDVLPHFLKLHSTRWPRAYKAPDFHKNLILRGLEPGIVDFTSLKCGNRVLGYHLGFTYKKRYYYYMPATDPEYENLSPGKILLFKLVENAIETGYRIFDHLRGNENYKVGWTNNFQPLLKFSMRNTSVGSEIRNLAYSIKQKIH